MGSLENINLSLINSGSSEMTVSSDVMSKCTNKFIALVSIVLMIVFPTALVHLLL